MTLKLLLEMECMLLMLIAHEDGGSCAGGALGAESTTKWTLPRATAKPTVKATAKALAVFCAGAGAGVGAVARAGAGAGAAAGSLTAKDLKAYDSRLRNKAKRAIEARIKAKAQAQQAQKRQAGT